MDSKNGDETLLRAMDKALDDLSTICVMLGGNGSEHAPTLLREVLGGFDTEINELPQEPGLYWHWSGDEKDSFVPINVEEISGKCFVSVKHDDTVKSVTCESYGGFWRKAIPPCATHFNLALPF
ncbi:hypothetical protein [Zooshikella sp. RANM57]|uniref:hypothetical protein n=1 Tax=Zooshikella sp. RANM57 TaxID=3425863 RepID=UPI003D6DC07E